MIKCPFPAALLIVNLYILCMQNPLDANAQCYLYSI